MGFTVASICCIVALTNAVLGMVAHTPKQGIVEICTKVLSKLSAATSGTKTDDEVGLGRIWVTVTGYKTPRRYKRQSPARDKVGHQIPPS